MTQIHIIKDFNGLLHSTKTLIRAIVAPHGEFALGKCPAGQWYIQHPEPGIYCVVHNLERLDYGVTVCKYNTDEALGIGAYDLTNVSFKVCVKKGCDLVDRAFEFGLNTYG